MLVTDTFANFTALSVELPFQVSLGHLNLLFSAGAAGSLWYPYLVTADLTPVLSPVAWMYLRAGAMLDLGSVMAGVSASARTGRLPGGVTFLSWPAPIQAGIELHWLLPGTRLLLSAMAAGDAAGIVFRPANRTISWEAAGWASSIDVVPRGRDAGVHHGFRNRRTRSTAMTAMRTAPKIL